MIQRSLSGTMLVVPGTRRFLQFFALRVEPNDYGETGVLVRDLDTMRVLHAFELPRLHRGTQAPTTSGGWMHAFDGARRVFLVTGRGASSNGPPQLVELDIETFKVTYRRFGPLFELGNNTLTTARLAGITYDKHSNSVVAIQGVTSLGTVAGTFWIERVPLDGSPPQVRRVRSCLGAVASLDHGQSLQQSVLFTEDHLFVTCLTPNYTILVVRLPRSSAFVEGTGAEAEVAGPVYLETSVADQAGRRIHVLTINGDLWVFDADEMAFVGVVATVGQDVRNPPVAVGVDQQTGRLFFQSPTYGFGVAEGRFFPIPQALTFPATTGPGVEEIQSDTATGRVFALRGGFGSKELAYDIYRMGPALPPPPPPDPDRNTADLEEAPGMTESRYFASGSGFGARVLLAKGMTAVPPMAGAGQQTTAQVFDDYVNSKCGYTDRELASGQVTKAEYDQGATAAEAAAADVDERTKVDLQQPSRCDVYLRQNGSDRVSGVLGEVFKAYPPSAQHDKGPGWKYRRAACSTSTGDERKADSGSRDADAPAIGVNEVSCPAPGGKLEARAASELRGDLSVGRTSTDVVIERTAQGVQSKVTSTASDIALPGNVTIGEIRSTATSRANGRPQKKPMSTHTMTIKNVRIGDVWVCTVDCHPDEVVERLRGSGVGRFEFRVMKEPDRQLLQGTPKGAQTAVQKPASRQASDRALVGDFRAEVPALEVVVYNDNFDYGKARQVYQFAGVSSTAGYNIVPLTDGEGFADIDDRPTRPDGLQPDVAQPESAPAVIAVDPTLSDVAASPSTAGVATSRPRGVRQIVQALLDGLQLIVTSPRHALLFLTAWAAFGFPAMVSRRRRLLVQARGA